MDHFTFQPIGIIRSCYKEKFGIPRQPGLVTASIATLELFAPYDCAEALEELSGFSHIWVVFVFHQATRSEWKPTVRPPRLGGNKRIGVFASRSPFRPNSIGLSAVRLEDIRCDKGHCRLLLRGTDLLDGTPVLDIKPYVPYADALPDAQGGFATQSPQSALTVNFTAAAAAQCADWELQAYPELRQLIEQILQTDPRPAYRANDESAQSYAMQLYELDVKWRITGRNIEVTALSERESVRENVGEPE